MGVAKRIYAGEQIIAGATEDATSATTGSLLTTGGAGFASQVYSGGVFVSKSTEASSSSITGSLVSIGGTGVALNIYAGSAIVVEGTTEATAATAGTLVSKGGLAVTYDMYAGGALVVTDTTNAVDTISGSIVTPGGLSAAKSAYFGGQIVSLIDDAADAAITNMLTLAHSTSGTLANNIGVGISVAIEDQGDQTKSGALDFTLDDKTDGSEDTKATLSLMSGGSLITAATLTGELCHITDGMYWTSGGTVSQATDINTGVTLNKESGVITTQTATTAAHGCDSFVVSNSKVVGTSIVFVSIVQYTGSLIINNPPDAKVSSSLCFVIVGIFTRRSGISRRQACSELFPFLGIDSFRLFCVLSYAKRIAHSLERFHFPLLFPFFSPHNLDRASLWSRCRRCRMGNSR
jgi:hypothetical protein